MAQGENGEIQFEPDFVLEDDEKVISGYVAGRGEVHVRRGHYLYNVGVIIRRRGTETSPTRYASCDLPEADDESELLSDVPQLAEELRDAVEIQVPIEEFHERVSDFDWAVVWTGVEVNELIDYADAIKGVETGFPAVEFPDFEVVGAVVPARVYQG